MPTRPRLSGVRTPSIIPPASCAFSLKCSYVSWFYKRAHHALLVQRTSFLRAYILRPPILLVACLNLAGSIRLLVSGPELPVKVESLLDYSCISSSLLCSYSHMRI